jgi:hypothetical protein
MLPRNFNYLLYCYAKEELSSSNYPRMPYQAIGAGQVKDKQILKKLQQKEYTYHLKYNHGGGSQGNSSATKTKL